jgi:GxxExxY protein
MDERAERAANAVIGAVIEVHQALGPGYQESVYEEALAVELRARGIPSQRQAPFALQYKGHPVGHGRLDFLVDEVLIIELKAVEMTALTHYSQVVAYLKATNLQLALLINFNVPTLKAGIKRIAR